MSNEPVHLRLDARTHPDAAARVAAWRDAFSLTCETVFAPDEAAAFAGSMSFHSLGAVMLVDARYTAHAIVRDREKIARTGREHVILDVFPEGGIQGLVGGRTVTVDPGDGFMMDLRGTMRVQLRAGRFIGIVMPRRLFEAQAGTASMHGRVFEAASPQAVLLNALLVSLADQVHRLPESLAAAFGNNLIGMIASCVGAHTAPSPRKAGPPAEPTIVRLRRHIERHAAEPDLDPDALRREFGLSRTAMYRLFRPEGGIAEAIRRRRAALALRALTDRAAPRRQLDEIAHASGFPDVRSLRRALQTIYGASPAELRRGPPDPGPVDEHGVRIGRLLDGLVG